MFRASDNHQYTGIQALRFIAALLVMLAHATLTIVERLDIQNFQIWRNGGVGVNIFFVISGFVMAVTSTKLIGKVNGWRLFLSKRLIRIVPMYWIATTLKVILVVLLPTITLHSEFELLHVINSYLFLPTRNAENTMAPIHAVGWTLIYEMFFYILFSIGIGATKKPILFVSIIFCILVAIGQIFDLSGYTILMAYTRPIMLQFVFGMLIGCICTTSFRLPPIVSLIIISLGFIEILTQTYTGRDTVILSFLYWGLPSILIVYGIVSIENKIFRYIPKQLLDLGNSSYSLYLFHPFMIPALGIVIAKTGWNEPLTSMLILITIPTLISLLIYKYIEQPITASLRNLVK